MKVAVSVGHNPEAPGAVNGKHSEYSVMSPVAGLLIEALQDSGHLAYIVGTGGLVQKVAFINACHCNCAVELHLNAGGGHGCETLYFPGSVIGKKLAEHINKCLVSMTGNKDRGIKEGWYRQDKPGVVDYPGDKDGDEVLDYFLKVTNCPSVIVEPYFIDTQFNAYGNAMFSLTIARAVAKGVIAWGESKL